MVQWLKQSTAATLSMGPFVDSVDGDSQEEGLSIGDTDVFLSKNGGARAAKHSTTDPTHDSDGWYIVTLDTTDTATLGTLNASIHVAGAMYVWADFMVVEEQVWDSFFGADKLDVNTAELANIDFGSTMKASINTEVDNALNTAIPGSPTSNSINERVATLDDNYTSTRAGYLNNINNASLASIALTGTYVNAQVKALDDIDLTATMKTSVNTEVDSALVDIDLDHMIHTTIGAGKPTAGSLMDKVFNLDGGQTFDPATDSLEAIRNNMAGADAAAIADAVWDETISGHTTGTTFGGKNQKAVPSESIADYKADVSNLDMSVSDVTDSVLDEVLTGHVTADSVGLAIKNTLKIGKNKWSLVTNQLIIYDDNGSTPLYTFNLVDSVDVPSMTSVYKRTPV